MGKPSSLVLTRSTPNTQTMDSLLPRATFVPLYYQLASLLEQKMDSNEYPPGSRLPTEVQLAADFNVSVITARSAMKMLLDRGRVERFPGKGTFVLERGPVRATWGLASIADIVMTTANSQMTTLSSAVVEPPEWVWRAFRLPVSERLHWMRNTRSVEQERFMVSDVYHHPNLTPLVNCMQFRERVAERKLVVMAVCEMAGVTLGEIRQSLGAALASGDLAGSLQVAEGSPLLVVERVFLGGDGSVLQVGKTHYRVDHYRYDLDLRPIEEGSHSERSPRRSLINPTNSHLAAVRK
jgi:DNA-binding GntR family transcriptional regulator